MTECRKTNKNAKCDETSTTADKIVCEPFSVCLPLGQQLDFDGDCLRLSGSVDVPDGDYGVVVVKNGCITDLRPAPLPEYTPAPCTPAATPCAGAGDADVVLQPDVCNLLSYDSADRLGAYISYEAGTGIDIIGCGGPSDPLVISLAPTSTANYYINTLTADVLPMDGSGTQLDPRTIQHSISGKPAGIYAGFTVDRYGHVIDYTEPTADAVVAVLGAGGIDVETNGGVATISQSAVNANDESYLFGGYSATVDIYGKTKDIVQAIDVTPGVYDFGNSYVTVNNQGSITAIDNVSQVADTKWSKFFSGDREATNMSFTSSISGQLRISYTGNLGAVTAAVASDNLIPIPEMYAVVVDGLTIPAYARIVNLQIIEVYALASPLYLPGDHLVEITGPAGVEGESIFTDTAYMDVELIQLGN